VPDSYQAYAPSECCKLSRVLLLLLLLLLLRLTMLCTVCYAFATRQPSAVERLDGLETGVAIQT
jgi:hypothetical protein